MKGTAGLFLTFPVKLLLNNPHRVGDTVIAGAQNVSRIDALQITADTLPFCSLNSFKHCLAAL